MDIVRSFLFGGQQKDAIAAQKAAQPVGLGLFGAKTSPQATTNQNNDDKFINIRNVSVGGSDQTNLDGDKNAKNRRQGPELDNYFYIMWRS